MHFAGPLFESKNIDFGVLQFEKREHSVELQLYIAVGDLAQVYGALLVHHRHEFHQFTLS